MGSKWAFFDAFESGFCFLLGFRLRQNTEW
jgi:hypothetical protein